jgi:thymidylate synthase (FAD)
MSDQPVNQQQLVRPHVPALDEILGASFPVLDQGFIRVVDYMGSDAAIVQAARVSYGIGTKKIREDRGLIRYLLRHRHTTPFEMCEIKLHLRVPMDTWRQWIRHRTANVNEYSTRYSVAIDAAQRTPAAEWRSQSDNNRQGSGDFLDPEVGRQLSEDEAGLQQLARDTYERRLQANVAREQARKDLPLSTYTEAYWKVDLHNLLHFLELRLDQHAQVEIRSYAKIIGHEVLARWCPVTWEAFTDYVIGGERLSEKELAVARELILGNDTVAVGIASEAEWLDDAGQPHRSRERDEFDRKAKALGLRLPWGSHVQP